MCPLLDELEIIRNHHVKNHTLLIDDLRCWNENDFYFQHYNFTVKDIIESVKMINKDYMISYENGIIPNDILVAQIIK
jgi:hypothetical protein